MKLSLPILFSAMALSLIGTSRSHGATTFVFDDFRDSYTTNIVVANAGQSIFDVSVITNLDVPGSVRTARLDNPSGQFRMSSLIDTTSRTLSLSADSVTQGTLFLDYDFLIPRDATIGGGDAITLEIPSSDHPLNPASVSLAFRSEGGAFSPLVTLPAVVGNHEIPFASFTGVDFSKVTDMEVEFDASAEYDGQISLIGVTKSQPSSGVPEPGYGMALLGLLGCAVMRRRKRA